MSSSIYDCSFQPQGGSDQTINPLDPLKQEGGRLDIRSLVHDIVTRDFEYKDTKKYTLWLTNTAAFRGMTLEVWEGAVGLSPSRRAQIDFGTGMLSLPNSKPKQVADLSQAGRRLDHTLLRISQAYTGAAPGGIPLPAAPFGGARVQGAVPIVSPDTSALEAAMRRMEEELDRLRRALAQQRMDQGQQIADAVRQQTQDLERQVQGLARQIQELREQNQALLGIQRTLERIESKIPENLGEIAVHLKEISEAIRQLKIPGRSDDTVRLILERIDSALQRLAEPAAAVRQEVEQLRGEIGRLLQEYERITQFVGRAENRMGGLEKLYERVVIHQQQQDAALASLRQSYNTLQDEHSDLEKLAALGAETAQAADAEVSRLEGVNQQLTSRMRELTAEDARKGEMNEQLIHDLTTLQREDEELRGQIKVLREQLSTAQTAAASSLSTIKRLERELAEQKRIAETEKQSAQRAEQTALEAREALTAEASYKAQYEQLIRRYNALGRERVRQDTEITEKQHRIEALQREIQRLEGEIRGYKCPTGKPLRADVSGAPPVPPLTPATPPVSAGSQLSHIQSVIDTAAKEGIIKCQKTWVTSLFVNFALLHFEKITLTDREDTLNKVNAWLDSQPLDQGIRDAIRTSVIVNQLLSRSTGRDFKEENVEKIIGMLTTILGNKPITPFSKSTTLEGLFASGKAHLAQSLLTQENELNRLIEFLKGKTLTKTQSETLADAQQALTQIRSIKQALQTLSSKKFTVG